jgi:hypothetical protein
VPAFIRVGDHRRLLLPGPPENILGAYVYTNATGNTLLFMDDGRHRSVPPFYSSDSRQQTSNIRPIYGLYKWVKRNEQRKEIVSLKVKPKIFEISETCHPELVSGSHPLDKNKMLNQVQHDTISF